MLEIEALYTNCMTNLSREWDTPEERQNIFDRISGNEDIGEFYRLLSVMEQAFGDPFQVTTKKVDGDAEGQEDNEDDPGAKPKDENENEMNDNEDDGNTHDDQQAAQNVAQSTQDAYKAKLLERKGDTIIKRKKIQLFKFWPKHLLRQGWLKYVSAASETDNINAAFLAVLVLDKVTQ